MNTNPAPRTGQLPQPMYLRVVLKWYSWAGLTLTLTAAYLAFDGQLRFGPANQLQAAPPLTAEVVWKPVEAVSGPSLPAPNGTPPVAANGGTPDVFANTQKSANQANTSPATPVLKAYIAGKTVIQTNYQEPASGPKISGAPPVEELPNPPTLAPMTPLEPLPTPEIPKTAPETPETTPTPGTKLDPGTPPPVPKVQLAPRKSDLPLPALPTALQPGREAKPLDATVLQQSEPIGAQPKKDVKVDPKAPPKADGPDTPTPASKEVDGLSQDERVLYNAAQNAVQLKNFPLAIERFEQLLKRRPDLVQIRGEYAGILSRAGEFRRTIAVYQELIAYAIQQKATPEALASFRIALGDAYVSAKDNRQAILQYAEAVRLVPNAPEYAVRLGRAYVFYNDQLRATQVFDRYLSQFRPDDPRAPAALGALLLDLERPAEAMPYLLAKKKEYEQKLAAKDVTVKESDILEVMTGLIRAYARLAERQAAMEVINEMANRSQDNAVVRLVLADILLAIEEFELAGQVYNQVLVNDPANGAALVGMARVHVEMYQPINARRILDSFIPNLANQRGYLIAYAGYHQLVGEYIEAKQIYRDMLRRNETDHEVRFALGRLYEYIKEWEKAKGEFAKIPPTGALGRQARIWFAQTLASQWKFEEAAEVARVLIADDPYDSAGVAAVTRHLSKAKKFEPAIAIARSYLATNPRSEQQAVGVRLALARALLDAGRTLDASKEYEIALAKPSGRIAAAYYGLARASARLGNRERAAQVLGLVNGLPGGDIRNRMILADLFAGDFDDPKVIELCTMCRNGDGGENLAVLVRLADALQRQSRFSGNPADCFNVCLSVLHLSPTNVRGHLALARAFAVSQNYRKSSAQYDQLILIDPEFTIPPRERARVLYSDHQYSAARSQYQAMLQFSADEQILSNMANMVQTDPKLRSVLSPYVSGHIAGPALRGELQRLAASGDEDVRLASQRLIADYDATLAWEKAFVNESQAKELKDYRNYEAIGAYQSATDFERTNTEMMFDLGQIAGALNYTQRALDMYSQVLQVDEGHRDAMVASERAQANMGPKFNGIISIFSQRGRSGLANINRERYTASGVLPLGDENEFVEVGYTRVAYRPTDDSVLLGNIPFIRAQKRFMDDRILAYGQLNVEQFQNRFKTRPTFDAGLEYYVNSWTTVRGGGYLENVAENGESMRQDIFRYGVYGGADFHPTRVWRFGGEYRYAHYSDQNDMSQLNLFNEVSLTPPPKQLKLVQKFFLQDFSEQTKFPTNPPDPNNLFGAVHPYFAPNIFTQVECRVEWWHWLSRDYFVHSNQCYYSLQYGIATDNNMVTYHNFKALLNYDVCTWLTLGTEASAIVSQPYKQYYAMGYLQIRFR